MNQARKTSILIKLAETELQGAKQKIKFGRGLSVKKGGNIRIGKYVEGKGVPVTLDNGKTFYVGHRTPETKPKLEQKGVPMLPSKDSMDRAVIKLVRSRAESMK